MTAAKPYGMDYPHIHLMFSRRLLIVGGQGWRVHDPEGTDAHARHAPSIAKCPLTRAFVG